MVVTSRVGFVTLRRSQHQLTGRRWHESDRVALARIGVKSVQQDVQQQGRTTTGMHDLRQRLRAAEVATSSCAPVVCIQMADPQSETTSDLDGVKLERK
jgi:hypothetical protein